MDPSPHTLRRKGRNKCAGLRSLAVMEQLSAPLPKASTSSQSGPEQSESMQQKHPPTDFLKRLDTSESESVNTQRREVI